MDKNADRNEGCAGVGYDDEVLCAGWAVVPEVEFAVETSPLPAGTGTADAVDATDFMARLYRVQGMVGR